ncbi:GNAT family N-acetyltransferase [Profundibacterium mesophilum]|uniref:Phospholipiddiacylglycerol acyltransferase n=1 Tax=Profundibacterium mesophilum KAUST100406-0324 TaxID=1037889 RepID=A0A921TDV3_9RHOB|nr:GNAT family N-acetyltransferase [Profundibacterium mesophilum]KAF0677218.1 phospholipiddiacylglycerol acyltransferase [Profundibacterium mesophilum KAUST100406-0324]
MTNLRLATPEDVGAIEAIAREAYEPYVSQIGRKPAPLVEDYAAMVDRGVTDVAEDAGGICGFVILMLNGGARLDNVAVSRRSRGKGVGRALIAHAERMAQEAGHDEITLYTNEKMTENLALYPRLGYRETHRATEMGLNRVYFAKALAGHPAKPPRHRSRENR